MVTATTRYGPDGQAIATTLPTTLYTYDPDSNLLDTVLPSGLTTANTYDGLNQLTEVKTTTASGSLVADYQYTVRADGTRTGLLEKILNPDNATFTTTQVIWAYDGQDRLIKETYDVNADGVGLSNSVAEGDYIDTYVYDPAGNRLSKSHDAGGNGSLTADAGDAVTAYRYGTVDANGNLQLASGDNRLSWEQTTTGGSSPVTTTTVYGYDANGSLKTKSLTTSQSGTSGTVQDVYQYDLKGQLVLATVDGTTTSYAYDSAGNQTF